MDAQASAVEPQPGDIGVTQIGGDVGRLIRFGQWLNGDGFANYEHCFVFVGDGQIVEAEPDGARIADLAEYDARTTVWVRCPDQYRTAVAEAARAFIGRPYGFLDYAVIAAHHWHLPIPGLSRVAASTRTIICSALAVAAARAGGWDLLGTEPAGYITPADLAALADPLS
jgi:hypothetical protein